MEVSFKRLSCTAPLSRNVLLDDVSGRFLPGELSGVLGPSGAGKTTLLNAISGYKRSGVKGTISAGSRESRCYISQEDLLAPLLTVGESMDFASRFKLSANYKSKERAQIVDDTLEKLGLDSCKNTRTEYLSGGQRKRLAIALELINDPFIIFLDEPTSGLDIVSASLLIRLLSKLAKGGRTVIITIHQPSASIFTLFDRVYFLSAGKCVYQGGPGPHLVNFLANFNFICPTHYNPADYLIEVVEDKKNIKILCNSSENGSICWYSKEIDRNAAQKSVQDIYNGNARHMEVRLFENIHYPKRPGFWRQFSVVLSRIILQTKRNTITLKLQLIHYVVCALMLCMLFFNRGSDGTGFASHVKMCLSVVVFHSYTHQMAPVVYYPFEVKLLRKEHFNQWYSLLPYYLAFKISKIPSMLIFAMIYSLIVYSMVGLPWDLTRFFLFYATGVVISFIAEAFGQSIGAIFNVTNASILGALSLAPLLGLAMYGFDSSRSNPFYMDLLVRTSFLRSGVISFLLVLFGLDRKQLECPEQMAHCHFKDPEIILHYLDLDKTSLWEPFTELFINMAFFWFSCYIALRWRLRS